MEYAKTRDILHVMQVMAHRNIKNTLIYTQLIKMEKEDSFYSATAKTATEAKDLGRVRVRIRMHNARRGYGFPKEEIDMARLIQNIPKKFKKVIWG